LQQVGVRTIVLSLATTSDGVLAIVNARPRVRQLLETVGLFELLSGGSELVGDRVPWERVESSGGNATAFENASNGDCRQKRDAE
jgi:hypothetical protein